MSVKTRKKYTTLSYLHPALLIGNWQRSLKQKVKFIKFRFSDVRLPSAGQSELEPIPRINDQLMAALMPVCPSLILTDRGKAQACFLGTNA